MKRSTLAPLVAILALSLTMDANARGRIRISSSHSPSSSAAYHPSGSSLSGDVGAAVARGALRSNSGSSAPQDASAGIGTPVVQESEYQRQIRQEKAEARSKANADLAAARQEQTAALEEKRRQEAETALQAANKAEQRRAAQEAAKDKETAMLDRKRRQAAWEARCETKPVMTDEEIATCKEVWSRPAP